MLSLYKAYFLHENNFEINIDCLYLILDRKAPIKTSDEIMFETAWGEHCPLSNLEKHNLISPESTKAYTEGKYSLRSLTDIFLVFNMHGKVMFLKQFKYSQ